MSKLLAQRKGKRIVTIAALRHDQRLLAVLAESKDAALGLAKDCSLAARGVLDDEGVLVVHGRLYPWRRTQSKFEVTLHELFNILRETASAIKKEKPVLYIGETKKKRKAGKTLKKGKCKERLGNAK
ncbi:hypothetical protein GW17_00059462, partial [Ensete ventricosum]